MGAPLAAVRRARPGGRGPAGRGRAERAVRESLQRRGQRVRDGSSAQSRHQGRRESRRPGRESFSRAGASSVCFTARVRRGLIASTNAFDGGCLAGQLTFSTGLGCRFKYQRQGLLGAGGIRTRVEACPRSLGERLIERSSVSARPAQAGKMQHLSQMTVGRWHHVTASCPDATVLVRRGLEVARAVTEASPSSRALRERSPRCVATRTAPGLLPTILATWATSSPATTRRMIISA